MHRLTERGKAEVMAVLMKHGNMEVKAAIMNQDIIESLYRYIEIQTNSGQYQHGRWRLGNQCTNSGYSISVTFGSYCFEEV